MVAPRVILGLRKRKDSGSQDGDSATAFPFNNLPYELRMMIAKESVLSPMPIVVGTKIDTWKIDREEELAARRASAMLRTCRDFSQGELYRHYYQNNSFELGYYYEQRNFFQHPGKDLVQYVIVDMLRLLMRPQGGSNTIIDKLKLLPNLRCVSVRMRGSFSSSTLFNVQQLRIVLIGMCRSLQSLKDIEILVESHASMQHEVVQEYEDFLTVYFKHEDVWPEEAPEGWTPVTITVVWEENPAAAPSRRASSNASTISRGRKLKAWVDGRLATQTRYFI